MGERTGFAPGTFCWIDLATTDQEAAKTFYSELFGWEIEDMPAGDGMIYSMARLNGRAAAAIAAQPPQQAEAGVPPAWNNYVSVESADAAAEKASELGGTVHAPPFDVLEAGRMAVIQDPQGAFFMAWEPRQMFGAGVVNEPGALCWNELASTDLEASAGFYRDLFGWTMAPWEEIERPYYIIQVGEKGNGGIRPAMDGEPPNWSAYFATDDLDGGVAKVGELGGTKMMDPIDIGVAKIAPVQDPQGAVFALYAGELQD